MSALIEALRATSSTPETSNSGFSFYQTPDSNAAPLPFRISPPAALSFRPPVLTMPAVTPEIQLGGGGSDSQILDHRFENPIVFQEPVFQEFVYEQPVYEEPVYEEPVYEEPAYQEPVYEEPVYQEPVYQEPVYEEPVYEEPVYQEPVYEEPAYEEPVYEEPAYQEPVYEEPAYEEPVYEEPAYMEPAYQEPVYQDIFDNLPILENPLSDIEADIESLLFSMSGF